MGISLGFLVISALISNSMFQTQAKPTKETSVPSKWKADLAEVINSMDLLAEKQARNLDSYKSCKNQQEKSRAPNLSSLSCLGCLLGIEGSSGLKAEKSGSVGLDYNGEGYSGAESSGFYEPYVYSGSHYVPYGHYNEWDGGTTWQQQGRPSEIGYWSQQQPHQPYQQVFPHQNQGYPSYTQGQGINPNIPYWNGGQYNNGAYQTNVKPALGTKKTENGGGLYPVTQIPYTGTTGSNWENTERSTKTEGADSSEKFGGFSYLEFKEPLMF